MTPDGRPDFAWALIGPGRIAGRFAEAVQALPGCRLHAVQGRDPARAQAFAARWSRPDRPPVRAHAALEALLADPEVDGVYIATPHAFHGAAVRAALRAGKPVLCEKSLVPTRAEAEALVALARERGLFLMEAVWTRFLPLYAQLGRWLAEGAIGPLCAIQSSFCFPADYDPTGRLFDPAQAGGALLDIGIYNLSVTRWLLQQALGACPEPIALHVDGVLAPSGVDQRVAAMLQFPGGISSQFVCALDCAADNGLRVLGERGVISLPRDFWRATEASLQLHGSATVQRLEAPLRINGFEGEIEEAMRCIRAGLVESPLMPHAESLATLGWLDEMRRRLGVRYPFE